MGARQESEKLVKAAAQRMKVIARSQMPLAEHPRTVPCLLENIGHGQDRRIQSPAREGLHEAAVT